MKKNINIYNSLKQLRTNNSQRTSTIEIFAVMSKCGFYLHDCQSKSQLFILTTCLFGGMMVNVDINAFMIARENVSSV